MQQDFAAATADVSARRARLKTALAKLGKAARRSSSPAILSPDHVLSKAMARLEAEFARTIALWHERVALDERNQAVRARLTDSLVVYVLGKVKAGKSSLGNYVAYGQTNPDAAVLAAEQVAFFTAIPGPDAASPLEPLNSARYFAIGAPETTNSVQGFTRPGLTWIDSPGLHSATAANGALAESYLAIADLVIYPMHSGNPGRTGDVEEICRLIATGKRFLALITQCDTVEEDEAADGSIVQHWAMKSAAARQRQIEYVRRALAERARSDAIEVISLSVRHAEAHGSTIAALEESGCADLFRSLTVIARSDGVRHKREASSRNLRHLASSMLGRADAGKTVSIASLRTELGLAGAALDGAEAEFDRCAAKAEAAVLARIAPIVAQQIERHAPGLDQLGFERGCATGLHRILTEEAKASVSSLLPNIDPPALPVIEGLPHLVAFAAETIAVPRSNRGVARAIGGAVGGGAGLLGGGFAGAALGSLLPGFGTVIGFVVGSTIAVAGSFAGQEAGQRLGKDWDETIPSGDNRLAVAAAATLSLHDVAADRLKNFFNRLKASALDPHRRRLKQLTLDLHHFSQLLETEATSDA